MCGFVGFVGGTDNQSEVLTKMMDRIVHRGPDMGGQFIDGRVALGFRRLSILDLTEAGAQPMANEDGSVVIVFNGEIDLYAGNPAGGNLPGDRYKKTPGERFLV